MKNFYIFYFSFILLIIINNNNHILSQIINFQVIQPKHLEKLEAKCKEENIFFCSMKEALIYSLTLLIENSKSFQINNCTDEDCLKYENVYIPNIICEDVDTEIKNIDEKYIIYFSNCNAIAVGDLSLNGGKKYKFLAELYFDKINFYQSPEDTKGVLNISFEYDTTFNEAFYYNKEEEIFKNNETYLISQMDNILKQVLEHFIYMRSLRRNFGK